MPERTEHPKTSQPYRVRLPGFVVDDDVGLGDAIKQVTYALGHAPCRGCAQRAAALNRLVVLAPRTRKAGR